MGNFCSRRRRLVDAHEHEHEHEHVDNDGWELVLEPPVNAHAQAHAHNARRFRRVVRRVVMLIRLRWLWATCMSTLNTAQFRQQRMAVRRRKIAQLAAYIRPLFIRTTNLFSHLTRDKGRLRYTSRNVDYRFHHVINRFQHWRP
jgi:hypothetical protein